MKGMLSFLAKAKLIELTDEELAEQGTRASAEAPVVQAAPVVVSEITEGITLETIFTDAQVPSSPYPAEKMLKLLAGLQAMDAGTRKTAIAAMDAADDTWTVADAVNDAQAKMQAIQSYKQGLTLLLDSKLVEYQAKKTELGAKLDGDVSAIRQQIQALQELLERTIATHAASVADIEAATVSTKEAVAREQIRLDSEVSRYSEIVSLFQPVV